MQKNWIFIVLDSQISIYHKKGRRFTERGKLVDFKGDLWAMRWSVTLLKWVYAASRRSIFSIGGLGSKSALLLEILASENSLFSNEKPPFLDNPFGLSDKNIINNTIFQGLSNGVYEFIRNLVYSEELEEVAFNYDLTWSSFDAHSSDTAPRGNLIWPVSKSPRMDLSGDI
jgi:hypothetical protein